MIDVSVKTLDGQTKSHSVAEDITVRQFKDIISSSISIPADTQRLIFQGRVLQDEKLLRDYNVHNKVIHVVQRPPPRPNGSGSSSSANSSNASAPPPPTRDVNSFVVGSFTLPSEILDPNQVQNIVQQAVHNMGELGRNARVSTRSSSDGSAVDVHINLGQIPVQQINESQQRVNHIKKLLSQVKAVISQLENPSNSEQQSAESSSSSAATGANTQGLQSNNDYSSDAESDTSQTSSSQQSNPDQSNATSSSSNQASSPPPASVLVELMGEIQTIQRRLEPFLSQYTSIANNDTAYSTEQTETLQSNGRIFNLVSESLHYLGHIYHGVSDLAVDLNQTPPRHLHAHTALPTLPGLLPSGITSGSIPVQLNQGPYRMGGGSGISGFASTLTPRSSAIPNSASGTSSTATSTVTSTITAPTAAATSSSRSAPIGTTLPIRLPTISSQTAGNLSSASPLNLGQSFATSSSSPYLFVEVGPDSLTVNSISAHVVSSVDTTSTSTPNTSSVQRTFQLNLDPSAGNSSQQSSSTTTTSSSAASTTNSNAGSNETTSCGCTSTATSTTTTNTMNSGIGVGPGRATVVLPGGMPNLQSLLGSQHNARTIDPYLPCMSRHFAASQAQNTGATNTGTASNTANLPNQPASNQAADAALGDVVAAVMAGLLGTNESQTANAPTTDSGSQPSSTPRATTNPVTIPQFSQAIGGLASPVFAMVSRNLANMTRTGQTTEMNQEPAAFVQTLRNLLQGAAVRVPPTVGVQMTSSGGGAAGGPTASTTSNSTTTTTNTSSATQSQSSSSTSSQNQSTGNQNQAIPDEAIVQLIRGISNNLTQAASGQQNVGTIWDVFSSIGDELDIEQFEGLNSDIFQCVARHFTIPDLMTVLLGNTEPLNRLREPLRDLVLNRILNGAEPNEANVQNAVLQLLAETREEIRVLVSIADVQPNIDAEGTLTNFLKHQYTKIIKLIIESEGSFGSSLYDWFKRFLSELIVLGRHCLVGGYPAFQTLVHDRLHHLTNGINVVMQQSMITMATLQLNAFTPQQTEDDIVHYIVWKDSDNAAESSSSTKNKQDESKRSEAEGASSSVAPMDVDIDIPVTQKKKPDSLKKSDGNRSQINGVHKETAAASSVGYNPSMEEEIAAASSNGDDWCNVVPAEWVPIIRQDIQQQRRQNSQTPFSDTYLSGMPAKRRKMNHGKSSNLSEGSEFVSDSLKKAVASAGVEPLSSLENLSCEAAHDTTLHSAFEEQMCHSVLQRIHLDSDYNPERFPNTEEYFKNQQDKK